MNPKDAKDLDLETMTVEQLWAARAVAQKLVSDATREIEKRGSRDSKGAEL